jgi:Protein of unknown function (DUF3551)
MRKFLGPLTLLIAVVGAAPSSFAQSAYDYPWCALYGSRTGGGAQSCYYQTYQQCMATMSGIGGTCVRSPYYRGPEPRGERRYYRY